jgi:hypothetical protein
VHHSRHYTGNLLEDTLNTFGNTARDTGPATWLREAAQQGLRAQESQQEEVDFELILKDYQASPTVH